jgi:AcrR family transcriptional regulator
METESQSRTRRDVLHEFRHSQILDAARQVFARRGFAEASMDEIAQAAGLAKGTLYLYYKSKQELHRASLREGLMELCGEIELQMDRASSLRGVVETYVATKVSYFERHRDFFRMYLAEFGNALTGGACADFRDLCFRQIDLLEKAISRTAKGPAPEGFARGAAGAVFDLTRGVVYRRLLGWSDSRVEDDVRQVVEFSVRALGSPLADP